MDKVRFGRALGYGARHAVKAAMNAAEAAAAPDPVRSTARPAATQPAQVHSIPRTAPKPASSAARTAQVKQAGHSFLSPIKQFSSTVFHKVLGTVFALFELVMGQAVWRMHAAFYGPHNTPEAHRLFLTTVMLALFTWFTISSFVRASRAGKH